MSPDVQAMSLLLSRFLQVADLSGMTGLDKLPPMFKPMVAQMLGGQDPAELLRQGLLQQAEQLTDDQARWVLYGEKSARPD